MTTTTTPRLGLMSPVDADSFNPDDFDTTMGVLDARPGILPVANYAALPAGLTSANNGSQFIQIDNTALWMWYQPSSGTAGVWKRTNAVGLLKQTSSVSAVSTSSTTFQNALTVGATVVPGGRSVVIKCALKGVGSNGIIVIGVNNNGSPLTQHSYNPGANGEDIFFDLDLPSTTVAQSLAIIVQIRAAAVAPSSGGGGTVTLNSGSVVTIVEQ